MPRLIDADALDDVLRKEYLSATDASMELTLRGSIIFDAVLDRVRCIAISQPIIDAEPVRHGRWIVKSETHGATEDDGWWREWYAVCSECRREVLLNEYLCETDREEKALAEYPYCHCGAKMDAKDINVPTKPETHRPEDCVNYATRQRDGRAVCLGTRELDPCDGAGCKRWKGKVKDE